MNFQAVLETARYASLKASERVMEVYATDFSHTLKGDASPLTLADTASHEIIVSVLKGAYPNIPVLSEEHEIAGLEDEVYCWVVDPLDGTKEFIKRTGEFTVNIALTRSHKPVAGVIVVPASGAVYFASQGGGAFRQERDGCITPLHVSDRLEDLIWAGSLSHSGKQEEDLIEKKRGIIKTVIQAGSSLKGVMVAEGKADVYYRFGLTCEWDTCAMQCIVEEAGGIFRQMDGSQMLYNRKNHLNEKGFFVVNRKENIWV
jgi:3'(2'), 5'-bisphosphate nucleotidase